MAGQTQRQRSPRTADAPAASPAGPERRSTGLRVAKAPPAPKASKARAVQRSLGGSATVALFSLFAACLALAALHAVLVENQASLDDLVQQNQLSRERLHQLQAEVAHLDSPEGLTVQAQAAGLVPAAELVVLAPLAPGRLLPPGDDPFGLAASGVLQSPEVGRPAAAPPAR
ncbi:MAG: hypothetical protein OXE79_07990 [Acidimicrobiaceae bacterium]|nr:hypothetical protein [Acidimicrobiaceae bacterium]MCY4279954.1 hypothetical protein [Acidimicrobiaceae bacterium]MCY4294579.1 hypothetical protein [Acidimicrobiaceae bacterium]